MTNITMIKDIVRENGKAFRGFVKNKSGRYALEFYVPKNNMDCYILHNEHIILTELPKRKAKKLDDRFDWSPMERKINSKSKYIKFRIFPHNLEDLNVNVIYGFRGSRFIISEAGIPLCVLCTNNNGNVVSVEFYNLPKYTTKYKNISNVFIDVISMQTLQNVFTGREDLNIDTSTVELTFRCTQMVDGQLGLLGDYRYKVPKIILDDEERREGIFDMVYDNIYANHLDQELKPVW